MSKRRQFAHLIVALSFLAALTAAVPVLAAPNNAGLDPDTLFYVPKSNRGAIAQIAELTSSGNKADARLIRQMIGTPQAVWFTKGTPKSVMQDVRNTVNRAADTPLITGELKIAQRFLAQGRAMRVVAKQNIANVENRQDVAQRPGLSERTCKCQAFLGKRLSFSCGTPCPPHPEQAQRSEAPRQQPAVTEAASQCDALSQGRPADCPVALVADQSGKSVERGSASLLPLGRGSRECGLEPRPPISDTTAQVPIRRQAPCQA